MTNLDTTSYIAFNRDVKAAKYDRDIFVAYGEEIKLDSICVVFQTSVNKCLTSVTISYIVYKERSNRYLLKIQIT